MTAHRNHRHRHFSVCSLVLASVLVCPGLAWAQGARGAINGTVMDSSGASIPGAAVTVTEATTGVQTKTGTTTAGVFRFVALPPGIYRIEATKPGFHTVVQNGIELRVAQTLQINFTLQVGAQVQTVTVKAAANVDVTPGAGTNVSHQQLNTWPILLSGDEHRELQQFIFTSLPGTEGSTFQGTINGGQAFSHEVLIDGITIGRTDLNGGNSSEMAPTFASVSQFKLQTGAMTAQYDDGETAVANFDVSSGTNRLHGQLYSFIQNEALDATGYDNNALGIPKAPDRITEYGGAAGGPIYIPHVYNGKDKAFWFVSFEKNKFTDFGSGGFKTLPPSSFLHGDFSNLLNPAYTGNPLSGTQIGTDALGRPVIYGQIYNPSTTRLVNGTEVRDPFAGNVIPQTLFDAAAAKYNALLPNPAFNRLLNNVPTYASTSPLDTETVMTTKEEYDFSPKQRISVMVNYNARLNNKSAYNGWSKPPGNPLDHWDTQSTPSRMVRFHHLWTITPSLLNDFGYGYNRFGNVNLSDFYSQDWAQKLGISNTSPATVPEITFTGPTLLGGSIDPLGSAYSYFTYVGSNVFQDQLTWIHGKHQFMFGTEDRFYYYNNRNISDSGAFTFSPIQTQLTSFFGDTGNAFASFLLGQTANATHSIDIANTGHRQREYSFYASDNWKLTPKLQLELGLRWVVLPGLYEVYGRMTSMNPDLPNQGAGGRDGALQFASQLGRKTFENTQWGQLEPRFGFAYAIEPRVVLRAGYGVSHGAPVINFNPPSAFGYNGSITLNPTTVAVPFPDAAVQVLSQPFPNFTGTLPDTNPSSGNGTSVEYIAPQSGTVSWIQNYNLGLEFLLGGNSSLDVNYVGNVGERLQDMSFTNMNQQPISSLQYGNALLDPLSAHPGVVPIPYSGFSSTVAQALAPFPQYAGVSYYDPFWGWSDYNSLQVQLTKHFSNGLSLLAAYTFSKALANVTDLLDGYTPQNVYNRREEVAVADFNVPQDLKLSWFYALPIGPNARFKVSGLLGRIVGGWTLSGLQEYRSGDVLGITESSFNDPLSNNFYPDRIPAQPVILHGNAPVNFGGASSTLPGYLNPAGFSNIPTTSEGVPLRLGTAPRHEPDARGPAWATESFSLFKDVHFGNSESRYLRIRTDWANAFNRTGRSDPAYNIDDPLFGDITDVQQGPRTIQVSLQLFF